MKLLSLTLILSLLPPAADVHNERAMAFDEAGQLAEAADELAAAYAAMPDPRADLEGREQVLGSLRGVLLRQHQQTGLAQPLCRLRAALRAHLTALEATFPAAPEPIELTGNRERLAAVDSQLAALPADACDPSPTAPPQSATPAAASLPRPATPAPQRAPAPPPHDGPTPTQLRITGGITLGLGLALLGTMTYGIVDQQRRAAAGRDIDAGISGRTITRDEYATLEDLEVGARRSRTLALATGISSAVFTIFSVALLAAASNKKTKSTKSNPRQNGVSLAPWWVPAGGGLSLRMPLP